MRNNMHKHKFIQRSRTHKGWVVVVPGQKKIFFYDHNFFGIENSFSEALYYRNELLNNLGVDTDYKGNLKSSKTTTGIIGVMEASRPMPRFIAAWVNDEGKQVQVSYSIKKYGYEEALRKAATDRFSAVGYGGLVEDNLNAAKIFKKMCENRVRSR